MGRILAMFTSPIIASILLMSDDLGSAKILFKIFISLRLSLILNIFPLLY